MQHILVKCVKQKKNVNKYVKAFYVILLTIIFICVFLVSRNWTGEVAKEKYIPESVQVSVLSGFVTDDIVVENWIRRRSSILVPVYIKNFEYVKKKESQKKVPGLITTYIYAVNNRMAEFILDVYIEEEERRKIRNRAMNRDVGWDAIQDKIEISKITYKLWNIDRGYYLTSDNSKIIVQKDNVVCILESNRDFSKKEIADIDSEQLKILSAD